MASTRALLHEHYGNRGIVIGLHGKAKAMRLRKRHGNRPGYAGEILDAQFVGQLDGALLGEYGSLPIAFQPAASDSLKVEWCTTLDSCCASAARQVKNRTKIMRIKFSTDNTLAAGCKFAADDDRFVMHWKIDRSRQGAYGMRPIMNC